MNNLKTTAIRRLISGTLSAALLALTAAGCSDKPAESSASGASTTSPSTSSTSSASSTVPSNTTTALSASNTTTTTAAKTPVTTAPNKTNPPVTTAPTISYPDKDFDPVDKSLLYGVCYVQYSMSNRVSNAKAAEMIAGIGAKSVRVWNHMTYVMSDYKTIVDSAAAPYHELYKALKAKGVKQIIGMSHFHYLDIDLSHFPNGWNSTTWVPKRDKTPGSDYMKFLQQYEIAWKTLAAEFPEVDCWEIGNEWNHDPFMNPIDYTDGSNGVYAFSLNEKADISTDLMFAAHKGIKAGNPKATAIMPAMAPVDGMWGIMMEHYLERIYDNIDSGAFGSTNSDDFFDALAWHPYSPSKCPDVNDWVKANQRLYAIAQAHGDDGKKVYLTEVGFPDGGSSANDAKHKDWVKEMYRLTKEQLPFVESLHYYRLFDDGADSYGLFADPAVTGGQIKIKEKGKAYLEIAGGTGKFS